MKIKSKSNLVKSVAAFLMLSVVAACGGSHDSDDWSPTDVPDPTPQASAEPTANPSTPTVLSVTPATGVAYIPGSGKITATFSEAMNPATITSTTFTLSSGAQAVPILGTVTYADSKAEFVPTIPLAGNAFYKATITTGAKSAMGVSLAAKRDWSFSSSNPMALGVNLGMAGDYVMLAKSRISTAPTSAITGDLGCSPAAASFITGFALTMDATNVFSTAAQVTGRVYAADYAAPTSSNLTTAVSDMETAFTDAAGRAPDVTELGAGNIGSMTLTPGVYKWGSGLLIPTDLTLDGDATGVWIFQIAGDLTMSSATNVVLQGGALPKNIFWQVSGIVDLDTTSHFEGVILSQTAITLRTGATINGRLLAQTAIDVDSSTIVEPAP